MNRAPNPRLQRTRRPSLRSGRSLRSLGSPLKRYPLGATRKKAAAARRTALILLAPVVLGVVAPCAASDTRAAGSRDLTLKEARQLVLTLLKAQGTPVDSPHFDLEEASSAELYKFYAYFDTPTRLNAVGFYGVSRRTADVWELVLCTPVLSKAIAPLQRRLRKEMGLPSSYRRPDPDCS